MSKYKYKNPKDYFIFIPELNKVVIKLPYLECTDGVIKIKKDYSWNGCTLAPDNEQTYLPSMVHDALYQYGKQLTLKRKVADKLFYYMLEDNRFKWRGLYYNGVRMFGWIFYSGNRN